MSTPNKRYLVGYPEGSKQLMGNPKGSRPVWGQNYWGQLERVYAARLRDAEAAAHTFSKGEKVLIYKLVPVKTIVAGEKECK